MEPKNWDNSGVKIFQDETPSMGKRSIEIQILDSFGITVPSPKPKPGDKTTLGSCTASDSAAVVFGEICGALYMLQTPNANPVNQAAGWVDPSGGWNSLEIN